jgi:hypothetical protein
MDIVFQLLTLDTRMRPCSQRTLITIPSIPGAARPSMRCSSCNPVSVLCCGELPFYRRRPWDLEWWNDCQLRSARGAYMQNGDPRGHSFYRQFFLSFALVWGIYITDWTSTMICPEPSSTLTGRQVPRMPLEGNLAVGSSLFLQPSEPKAIVSTMGDY